MYRESQRDRITEPFSFEEQHINNVQKNMRKSQMIMIGLNDLTQKMIAHR
jgi:hypothetical protein